MAGINNNTRYIGDRTWVKLRTGAVGNGDRGIGQLYKEGFTNIGIKNRQSVLIVCMTDGTTRDPEWYCTVEDPQQSSTKIEDIEAEFKYPITIVDGDDVGPVELWSQSNRVEQSYSTFDRKPTAKIKPSSDDETQKQPKTSILERIDREISKATTPRLVCLCIRKISMGSAKVDINNEESNKINKLKKALRTKRLDPVRNAGMDTFCLQGTEFVAHSEENISSSTPAIAPLFEVDERYNHTKIKNKQAVENIVRGVTTVKPSLMMYPYRLLDLTSYADSNRIDLSTGKHSMELPEPKLAAILGI